jgi:site-specific recombinase XerD
MTTISLTGLKRDIEAFLIFKRAMGYAYVRAEHTLRSFERFARHQASLERCSRIELETTLRKWLCRGQDRTPFTVALDLGVLRQLCLYRRRRDPQGFVPEHDWAPATESIHVPHIFSREQVKRLLEVASRPRSRNVPAEAVYTLMLILYCTGLRFGEAVRLQMADVDLRQSLFHIRESKGRSRIVPFGDDLTRQIKRYLLHRQSLVRTVDPAALFIGRNGRQLTVKGLSDVVRRIMRQQGMKPARGRVGARPYDFRHTFAVHRLTEWYRKGEDIHARLPWLSAYMGHLNVLGTETYLHATPELLRLASQRLKRRLHAPLE